MGKPRDINVSNFPTTDWNETERLTLINALVNERRKAGKSDRARLDQLDRFIEMLSRANSDVLEQNRAQILEGISEPAREQLHTKARQLRTLFTLSSST